MSRHILLLSGGAKVATARIAKESAQRRGGHLFISDCQRDVPARFVADRFLHSPPAESHDWIRWLEQQVGEGKIGLILPTRESDLGPLAAAHDQLKTLSCHAAVSPPETIELCSDKWRGFQLLTSEDLPTPATCLAQDFPDFAKQTPGPYVAKPRYGAGGQLLRFESVPPELPPDWIVQQAAPGQEFTVNVYLNRLSEPLCIIPHRRLVVDAGESVQARTERHPEIEALARKVVSRLPGACGPLNIQLILDEPTAQIKVIEINPRIGGGFPLVHAAKGAFIEWLAEEYLDDSPPRSFDSWTENLTMYRYRDSIFELG